MITIIQAPWLTKNKRWPLLLSLAPKIGSGTEVIEVATGARVVRRRTEREQAVR